MLERLQKILSARGIASRRKAEEYILAGLVKVNGKVAILGQKADPEKDTVEVDGKVVEARKELLYYVMQKPVGVVTENISHENQQTPLRSSASGGTSYEGQARKPLPTEASAKVGSNSISSVRDLLPAHLRGKLFPVGRLDKDSSGLLLFTNDGVLAYRLTHPKFDHEKEYEVTTEQPIPNGALRKLAEGDLKIFGEKTKPATVRRLSPSSFRIAITEGRNRQIRRMCQKVGSPVKTLRRIRIVTLEDAALPDGKVRELTEAERTALLRAIV